MKKKKIYIRKLNQGNINLKQLIFFGLVFSFSKAGFIDGGNNQLNFDIKLRKNTNL